MYWYLLYTLQQWCHEHFLLLCYSNWYMKTILSHGIQPFDSKHATRERGKKSKENCILSGLGVENRQIPGRCGVLTTK